MSLTSKDYRSWDFRDRSFLWAITISLLWHFFWFFAVTIVVSPKVKKEKPRPNMVSLGPVLDDSIFKALIENKPQISEAFYRQPGDLSPAMEADVVTAAKHSLGDVVSVPAGAKLVRSLKALVDGEKLAPNFDVYPIEDYQLGDYREDVERHV